MPTLQAPLQTDGAIVDVQISASQQEIHRLRQASSPMSYSTACFATVRHEVADVSVMLRQGGAVTSPAVLPAVS